MIEPKFKTYTQKLTHQKIDIFSQLEELLLLLLVVLPSGESLLVVTHVRFIVILSGKCRAYN